MCNNASPFNLYSTIAVLAAAQFGIFATLLGAIGLTTIGIFDFSLNDEY